MKSLLVTLIFLNSLTSFGAEKVYINAESELERLTTEAVVDRGYDIAYKKEEADFMVTASSVYQGYGSQPFCGFHQLEIGLVFVADLRIPENRNMTDGQEYKSLYLGSTKPKCNLRKATIKRMLSKMPLKFYSPIQSVLGRANIFSAGLPKFGLAPIQTKNFKTGLGN